MATNLNATDIETESDSEPPRSGTGTPPMVVEGFESILDGDLARAAEALAADATAGSVTSTEAVEGSGSASGVDSDSDDEIDLDRFTDVGGSSEAASSSAAPVAPKAKMRKWSEAAGDVHTTFAFQEDKIESFFQKQIEEQRKKRASVEQSGKSHKDEITVTLDHDPNVDKLIHTTCQAGTDMGVIIESLRGKIDLFVPVVRDEFCIANRLKLRSDRTIKDTYKLDPDAYFWVFLHFDSAPLGRATVDDFDRVLAGFIEHDKMNALIGYGFKLMDLTLGEYIQFLLDQN